MKLHQLRYFQCLSHYLHYRKASEALYISQPTLSFAIKELGKKLGVALFKKEGRTIQLSQEGKIFLDYVSKSLQILDEGIHAIQPKKEIKISSIHLGHEFVKNGEGVIINMSSESGLEGSEGQSIYAATKKCC